MGSLTMTRRSSVTSVRKPSNGSMLTSWQKRRNMTTSRRNWKVSAILSSPSFTQQPVVRVECQVECQEECQVECQVVCQEECQVVEHLVEAVDLLLRRLTKLVPVIATIYIYCNLQNLIHLHNSILSKD